MRVLETLPLVFRKRKVIFILQFLGLNISLYHVSKVNLDEEPVANV
jgi:hypothetical protein